MKRRDFLQKLLASGFINALPFQMHRAYGAQAVPHFFVMVNAGGGWDPTHFCDPKGLNQAYPDRAGSFNGYDGSVNRVALDENKRIGDIQWSAIPDAFGDTEHDRIENQFDNLFQSYGSRMTVINGLDTGTNNHATGNRYIWSGQSDMGYPSFAALYAGATAPSLPMSFISNGGYDETAGLVARARANNANYLSELADSNYQDSTNGYFYRNQDSSVDVYQSILSAQRQRLVRQQTQETLPLRRKQLAQLLTVREEDANLGAMKTQVDLINENLNLNDHMNNRNRGFKTQAQVAAAAFSSGLSAAVMLNSGGFDTHGNHDVSQTRSLGDLFEGVDYLLQCLSFLGIAHKTTVVMGSDFGRTPYYNSGQGKDHWPVSSMMVLHDSTRNTGGKVFGATSEQFRALPVNSSTGLHDEAGIILTPAHVHKELRVLAGIDQASATLEFPISQQVLSLF